MAAWSPWTASTWRCGHRNASASSGRTAPARPPPSKSVKAFSNATRAGRRPRPDLGARRTGASSADRHLAPGNTALRETDGSRAALVVPELLRAAARRRLRARRRTARRQGLGAHWRSLGRAEAATRRGVRAHRRSRTTFFFRALGSTALLSESGTPRSLVAWEDSSTPRP